MFLTLKNKRRGKIQVKTVGYTYKQNYNKTIVVGHALSDHKAVMKLLNAGGMSIAKPLQQHSIEATGISQILSQTYNPTGISKEQLSIDKVWDGLALDLFMSNRDEKWWGWSDSKALLYLNYWKSIDSKLGFIFIYDTPESFLKQVLSKNVSSTPVDIATAIDEWCEYNEALLKFYYRNMECSLLVNTQQVKLRTTEYLQKVSKQIGLNSAEIDDNAIITLQETFKDETSDPLFSYLVADVLKEYPNITNLFEEMQSVANLAFNVSNEMQHDALDALLALQNEKEQYNDLQEKIRVAREKNDVFQNKISSLQKKQKELAEKEKSKTSENELLLTQLMSVQEELEKYYLASQKSTKELESLQKSLQEKQKENEALVKESVSIKQSKSQELQRIEKSIQEKVKENEQLKVKLDAFQKKQKELAEKEKSKTSENELLLTQLMSVQEELEKYYLENRRLKEKKQEVKRYYGAAERVKQQLSYILGAKMIEESKSFGGMLGMPFTLSSVYKEYKKDMKEREDKKLPPIKIYADAYEAERVKKHLSYRLGQAMIQSMKSPFGVFILPFALKKAHREYKEERLNV